MYLHRKIIPVETIPGMGRGKIKENGGRDEFNIIYLLYCNNFYKCHIVSQPAQQ
jgi:hypothetical protein